MNSFVNHTHNADEMLAFGAALGKASKNGMIIFLYGPLGTGKTTLVRGFLRALGYHQKVKSPTYTIVETYELTHTTVFHFDFYRLDTVGELKDLGLEEYFSADSISLIEWPEKGFPLLPPPDLACYITFEGKGRELRLETYTETGENSLKRLNQFIQRL